MYKRIKPKKNPKSMKKNLNSHLHPDLLKNPRVNIQATTKENSKRGLPEGTTPFPVIDRVGPYEIKDPINWKNYYWCSCGLSKN